MPKIPLPVLYSQSGDETTLPDMVGAKLINGYTDKIGSFISIDKFPGLELLVDININYGVDGAYWWDYRSVVIFVVNGRIYKMTSLDGNYIDVTGGNPLTVLDKVSFADNGPSLMMASGGQIVSLFVENGLVDAPALAIGSTNTAVANGAFTYYIGPTLCTKAAVAAGTAPGNDVIPQNKYGAVAFDIASTGTITAVEASANSTGYDSAALALAGLAAVSQTKVRMGTVTAMRTAGAFTFGTTALDDADSTVVYTDGTPITLASDGWPTALYISDTDAPTTVDHVDYEDYYFLALDTSTGDTYWCDVNAPQKWTSTSFANAESKPDRTIALHIANREINMFGKDSLEIWYNDGVNPFSRIDGAFIEQGWSAKNSIVNAGGVWIGLNHERRVVMIEGRTPKYLSGPYDDVIRDIAPVVDARAYFISIGKQAFYIITFPTHKKTFCYNLTSDTWSELGYWDSSAGEFTAWPGQSYTYAKTWQYHLVGDKDSGKIYRLRSDKFQNNGSIIRTVMRFGWVSHGTLERKYPAYLELRVKRGAGDSSGNEPVFTIRWRNENQVWKSERTVSLGKIGDYEMIIRLNRMGSYKLRQYEICHTDNCDFVLSDMEENIPGLKQ
jgi:hypothetical protein